MSTLAQISLRILTIVFTLAIGFHLSILFGIVPYSIAWGGRLETKEQMLVFETISILVNIAFLIVVLARAEVVRLSKADVWTRFALWLMGAIFALNTVGNLFSQNEFEKTVFTPVTAIAAFLCLFASFKKERIPF